MENKAAAKGPSPARQSAAAEDFEEAPQAATFSVSVTRRRKAERPAAPRSAAPREERPREAKPAATGVARYLEVLGVGPNASFDAINTAYYTVIKRFPENPTEEDEATVQEVRRAYDIVRRRYVPPKAKAFQIVLDKRVMLPLLAISVLALGGTFLWMNWNNVQLSITHYEPGAVLRLRSAATPYGTVTGYESTHRFPAGVPSPAYSIKLSDKDETVWVSERLVVLGMVPAGN